MQCGRDRQSKMAEDREVLREIWDGRLPVCFNLSSDEVVTMEHPEPYYVSRYSPFKESNENFATKLFIILRVQ